MMAPQQVQQQKAMEQQQAIQNQLMQRLQAAQISEAVDQYNVSGAVPATPLAGMGTQGL
jgi:hypothetical protein